MANDEIYDVEDMDMDADIQRKQELIEEIKSLDLETDGAAALRAVNDMKRRWNRIHYWESDYEDGLRDEFESYVDKVYAKRNELYKTTQAQKEDLIEKAKETANIENFNQGTQIMNDLMDAWKAAGSAGKVVDDQLWEQFQAARQVFYDRKHAHWEEQTQRRQEARTKKAELIEKAKELADSHEWQKTSSKMRDLMNEWKAAGSAGRKYDDNLWEEFNGARQQFYEARNAYYDELHKEQAIRAAKKRGLIDQAKAIAEKEDYSRQNTQTMKQITADWKAIGSTGKNRDDELWAALREQMDSYFDGLKKNSEARQMDWRNRMSDSRVRKQEIIANQKRQISRLQDDMFGLVSEAEMVDIQQQIEDKEDFIAQLEAEIADIDNRLND